jgi:hypothetical protein
VLVAAAVAGPHGQEAALLGHAGYLCGNEAAFSLLQRLKRHSKKQTASLASIALAPSRFLPTLAARPPSYTVTISLRPVQNDQRLVQTRRIHANLAGADPLKHERHPLDGRMDEVY